MAAYPAAYREQREEEIVGLLLDCAEPGRSRPRRAEVIDLLRAGATARLRGRGGAAPSAWNAAATVVGTLLVVLLSVQGLRFVVFVVRMGGLEGTRTSTTVPSDLNGWFVAVVWAAVLVAILLGWTRAAMILAWVGVAARVVALESLADVRPAWTVQPVVVQLTLAVVAAVILSRPSSVRATVDVIGRVKVLALAAIVAGGYGLRLAVSLAPGTEVLILAVAAAVVLLRPRGSRLVPTLVDPITRRIVAMVVVIGLVHWVSGNWIKAAGPQRIEEIDLVLTFLIGMGVVATAVAALVAAPPLVRRIPVRVVRRP